MALYGPKTWTILKTERAKIEGFEVWYWNREFNGQIK